MEFGLISQWVQLGFGGVVSVALIYFITIYNPRRDKAHRDEINSMREEFTAALDKAYERHNEQMDAYRKQHVDAELEAHKNIIEMCMEQHQLFIQHDKEMREGMRQIIFAVMLLNPDISPTDRQKITDRLMKE